MADDDLPTEPQVLDADQRQQRAETILSRPPRALDLTVLQALPGLWDALPREARVAIHRAVEGMRGHRETIACHLARVTSARGAGESAR